VSPFKSHTHNLQDFSASALVLEMGITSPLQRDPRFKTDKDAVPDPEVNQITVMDLVAFVAGLAPPRRAGSHPEGEAVFQRIGCATCHRADTSADAKGAYTDLCVHDMGPKFDDAIVDFLAGPTEWRTAPLWGLRFRKAYFHDDRTTSIDEAIEMHGGESAASAKRYADLPAADKDKLKAFLKTL